MSFKLWNQMRAEQFRRHADLAEMRGFVAGASDPAEAYRLNEFFNHNYDLAENYIRMPLAFEHSMKIPGFRMAIASAVNALRRSEKAPGKSEDDEFFLLLRDTYDDSVHSADLASFRTLSGFLDANDSFITSRNSDPKFKRRLENYLKNRRRRDRTEKSRRARYHKTDRFTSIVSRKSIQKEVIRDWIGAFLWLLDDSSFANRYLGVDSNRLYKLTKVDGLFRHPDRPLQIQPDGSIRGADIAALA